MLHNISNVYVLYFTFLCNVHIFEGGVYFLCFPLILKEGTDDDVKKAGDYVLSFLKGLLST